jgi:hypothetical protein
MLNADTGVKIKIKQVLSESEVTSLEEEVAFKYLNFIEKE